MIEAAPLVRHLYEPARCFREFRKVSYRGYPRSHGRGHEPQGPGASAHTRQQKCARSSSGRWRLVSSGASVALRRLQRSGPHLRYSDTCEFRCTSTRRGLEAATVSLAGSIRPSR